MNSLMQLTLSAAAATGGIFVFAVLRRFLTSPKRTGFLQGNLVAYTAALAMTLCFALTMVAMGRALMPIIGNTLYAAMAAVVVHAALFLLISYLIPSAPGTDGTAKPTVSGAASAA